MRCPNCDGTGKVDGWDGWTEYNCEMCHGKGYLTEQEYIQTCNTEQLADAIYECVMANSWNFNKDGIKRWLEQPHKEK